MKNATKGSFVQVHRVIYVWAADAFRRAGTPAVGLEIWDRFGFIREIQDKLDGSEAQSKNMFPEIYSVVINMFVVIFNMLICISAGSQLAQSKNKNEIITVVQALLQVAFYVFLLEFCTQVLNSTYGQDCLDIRSQSFISILARDLQTHFKSSVDDPHNVN